MCSSTSTAVLLSHFPARYAEDWCMSRAPDDSIKPVKPQHGKTRTSTTAGHPPTRTAQGEKANEHKPNGVSPQLTRRTLSASRSRLRLAQPHLRGPANTALCQNRTEQRGVAASRHRRYAPLGRRHCSAFKLSAVISRIAGVTCHPPRVRRARPGGRTPLESRACLQ